MLASWSGSTYNGIEVTKLKRLISFFLSLILLFGLVTGASAAGMPLGEGAAALASAARDSIELRKSMRENVPILMYHQIGEEENSLYLSEEHFRQHLEYFKEQGYTTVTMSQLYDHWGKGEPLPEKCIALTFDDGYRSMYEVVFPMLQEYGFTATFYVIPAAVWSPWSVDEDMIKEMAEGGMEIGSHTYSHYQLDILTEKDVLFELQESKKALETVTGKEIHSLCYPVGRYTDFALQAASDCGYTTAVTTAYGFASLSQGLLSLERIRITRGDNISALELKLQGKLK